MAIQKWEERGATEIAIQGEDTPEIIELRRLAPKMETSRLVAMIADPGSEIVPYVVDDQSLAVSRAEETRRLLVAFVIVANELDTRIRPRDIT